MHNIIETSVTIHAPASNVWDVFINPEVTQKMGGEYVSGWQVGSSFGFKMGGSMITSGKILAIEPGKLLQHSLFGPDSTTVISTVTYTLQADGSHTVLTGREEFPEPLDGADYSDVLEGWKAALATVKDVAEA
jgi:uncharacterized protein YndB with AHSA1/START domain